MTSYQSNLDETKPIFVAGTKGLQARNFSKTFKNYPAFLRWCEKYEVDGDYQIDQVRNVD